MVQNQPDWWPPFSRNRWLPLLQNRWYTLLRNTQLGAGWRLPLISELLDAYQNGLPNGEEPFLPCAYWSASHDNLGLNPETEKWDVDKLSIVTMDFSTGAEAVCDIDAINPQGTRWNMRRARAVRTYVVAVEVALPLEEAA
jgi:hypothetical protein